MPLASGASGTPGAPSSASSGRACVDFWKKTPRGEKYLVCVSKASGASSVTIAAPAIIWGYRNGQWYEVKRLNSGSSIIVTSGNGYAEIVDFLGIWERLAF